MKRALAFLSAFACLATLSASASDTTGIVRMISFTTLHTVKLEVVFSTPPASGTQFGLKITDSQGASVADRTVQPDGPLKEGNKLVFHLSGLSVLPWTPTYPRLYQLQLTVMQPDRSSLVRTQRIGFRTFESRNGNLYLNGKPIFLRGIAINPPGRGIPDSIERSRKFAEDYVRFMKSIHVNIIRIPNDDTWYDVCDENGMMVFGGNYSGSVNGGKPPKDYDKAIAWYENKAFAMIAHHPSLMIYALTNETPFQGKLVGEWEKFLSYAAAQIKQWDSTRVTIANAGYGYGKAGDICDLHRYWGWYYSSPFTFLHIRNNEDIIPFPKKVQPVTFTECVGNYSGPDGRYNLTPDHKNPGSQLNWTGHAPDDIQARLANEHQCFTFKQATELNRRLRSINPELSGVFPFTILFYNWQTIQNFIDMDPKPVTRQARLSYSPVLVSWENWTTQLYTGAVFKPVLHIVNDADDYSSLEDATFTYELQDETGTPLLTGSFALPAIAYYATFSRPLSITLPAAAPAGHYQLVGRIIKEGKIISENNDQLFIAGNSYVASAVPSQRKVLLYGGGNGTASALRKLSIPFEQISSFKRIPATALLIIGEDGADERLLHQAAALKQFVTAGGRILCLRQDSSHLPRLNALLSSPVKNITMDLDISAYPPPPRPSRNGYYINPERPEHPVFDGIDREELKVWSDYTGWSETKKTGFPALYPVTDGFIPEDKKDMAHISVLGDYGPGLEGMAIAELFDGKGSILLCGMDLVRRNGLDPVADRLLANLAGYMGDSRTHDPYVLVTGPVVWGDYASEKGLLTGINSGLLLNSRPRLTGSYRSLEITITRDGHELAGGERSGFNTRPGLQYIAYGRRPFGPYILRGFGNVPAPVDTRDSIGEGTFYCSLPRGRTHASTLVWNPSDIPLSVRVRVNDKEVTRSIAAGEKVSVDCPVNSTHVRMTFTGDRRLVLLQTAFTN